MMREQRERQLKSAIAAYTQRQQLLKQGTLAPGLAYSFHGVANEFSACWETLHDQVSKGSQSLRNALEDRQLFSAQQEKSIVQFCEKLDDLGHPLDVSFATEMARDMFKRHVCKHWLLRFLSRYPELCSKFITRVICQCKAAEDSRVFWDWFWKLHRLLWDLLFGPGQILNMNEKSFMIGMSKKISVVCHRGRKNARYTHLENLEFMTATKTISTNGHVLSVYIIYRRKVHLAGRLAHAALDRSATFTHSSKAFSNKKIGVKWLEYFDKKYRPE